MDTPTNHRHAILNEEGSTGYPDGSLNSSSSSSINGNTISPIHNHISMIPPGSPNSPSLRPNRRSVDALKKVYLIRCSILRTCFECYVHKLTPDILIHFEAWARLAQQWLVCAPLGIRLEPINKELMLLVTI